MSDKIKIKQARDEDIPVIENILLDTVGWLNETGRPMWGAEEIKWGALSKKYPAGSFYIAYFNGVPAGCMAIIDHDPFFWPDIKRGESLFIHKLAVTKSARKTGVADALIDFFKDRGAARGVKTIRLDTHALRPKLRLFYERHGFVRAETKIMGEFHVAFYVYTLPKAAQNKFIYGTGNPAKLQSMRGCLAPLGIEIIGLKETGIDVPEAAETGNTPLENARIKALAYYAALKRPVFACDSGLYIDGLADNEQPGVNVRIINGRRLSDDEMVAHYAAIASKSGGKAVARYKNAICLVMRENEIYEHSGDDISGEAFCIVDKPHQKRIEGFPLDCISVHIKSGEYYYWHDKDSDAGMVFKGFQAFFRDVTEKIKAD